MKTGTLVSILTFVFTVMLISSCATTPKVFFQSSRNGDYAEVKRLIEEGADVNAQDNYGQTALMYASGEGHREVVKLLIEEGADVNLYKNTGWTALMDASVEGNTEVAKLLIDEGADVNAQDNDGYTALMYALNKGHTEIVQLLREAGATERIPRFTKPKGEYLHPQTKTLYPDVIGSLKRMGVANLGSEQPGLGISIAYGEYQNQAGRIKVNIYINDRGLTSIPDGTGSPLISKHFEQAVSDIYTMENKGIYRSVEKLAEEKTYLGSYPALSATFSYYQDDIEKVSYIYLTGYKNHFFKIRFTYYKSAEIYGEKTLSRFLDEIGKILAKGKEYSLKHPLNTVYGNKKDYGCTQMEKVLNPHTLIYI